MQLGRHHLDVSWEEIRELRANVNFMKIILRNDECYMFPIGWCKEAARFAVEHHKKIKHWTQIIQALTVFPHLILPQDDLGMIFVLQTM